MFSDEPQPAEEGRDQNGGRQQAPRQNASLIIGRHDGHEAATRPRPQGTDGEHEERRGGR